MNPNDLTEMLLDDPNFRELLKEFCEGQCSPFSLYAQMEIIRQNVMECAREPEGLDLREGA